MEKNIFTSLQITWNVFVQFAAWILTLATTFIVQPPKFNQAIDNKFVPLTSFIVTALAAIIFIPLNRKAGKRNYKFWYRIAIVTLVFLLASIATYIYLGDRWTVKHFNDTLVKGDVMTEEARHKMTEVQKKSPFPVDDQYFVKTRLGRTETIWPADVLWQRLYILTSVYICCVILIGLFIITIVQSIYCYQEGGKVIQRR